MTGIEKEWRDFVRANDTRVESPYERLFIETVLARVPNIAPSMVSMQTTFQDSGGTTRRIDFTIVDGPVTLALEVDGYDKTGRGTGMTRDEFNAWSARELEMSSQGWKVLRFANSLVKHAPKRCAREIELNLVREREKFDAHAAGPGARAPDEEITAELARLKQHREAEIEKLSQVIRTKEREAIEARNSAELAERRREQAEREKTAARQRQIQSERKAATTQTENKGMKTMGIAMAVIVVAFVGYLIIVGPAPPEVAQLPPPPPEFCAGAVPWNLAGTRDGDSLQVVGPVVSTTFAESTNGSPTYLNVGRDFPNPERLTVVIWGDDRANFPQRPELLYAGETICIRGTVGTFRGGTQIAVEGPEAVEIERE